MLNDKKASHFLRGLFVEQRIIQSVVTDSSGASQWVGDPVALIMRWPERNVYSLRSRDELKAVTGVVQPIHDGDCDR